MGRDLKEMYRTIMEDHFPDRMTITLGEGAGAVTIAYEKVSWVIDGVRTGLRYGENPGQEAALYKPINGNLAIGGVKTIEPGRWLVSDAELIQFGKHPGKINITDADNALNILRYLAEKPTVAIMKHNNPCGVAMAGTLAEAYDRANMADRVAAFGGCIALNRPCDVETAKLISANYAEVVVAPGYEEKAVGILAARKNLRIMVIERMDRLSEYAGERFVDFKSLIDGGIIAQLSFVPETRTRKGLQLAETVFQGRTYKVNRAPADREYDDMLFGWMVEAGVTSNSVIYVKDGCTVGIGTGEQDRVGVAEIARDKAYRKLADRICFKRYKVPYNDFGDAGKRAEIDDEVKNLRGGLTGSVMVSDAFFPFRDGADVGLREGVTAIIQPGGSVNDYQSIEACNEHGATMVYTGQRSFRH
jgi:phosphoribosylaminoimidazolecarboxamide formyltransferase/IMP cyclohydrolase